MNAQKAALGCLRESGKLIISIDEEDLIKMVSLKEKGEEPSDYLLDKVEDLLMLVSKWNDMWRVKLLVNKQYSTLLMLRTLILWERGNTVECVVGIQRKDI